MNSAKVKAALAALMLVGLTAPAVADAPPQLTEQQAMAMIKGLSPRSGKIPLPQAHATLDLGNAYVFYGPEDAKKILVDLWGNPPQAGEGVLGLVMPAGTTPASNAWGAVITYEATGYVSDEDANSTDYTKLLEQLKTASLEADKERTAAGYPSMTLVGWAENPRYDAKNHSMIWARDLKVGGAAVDSLNYDVRSLGRNGVLSVNFLSELPQLGSIRMAAAQFASHASFDPGFRYEEFDASLDEKAEYGVGGLILAGAGVAAAKKLGFLAILLKFLKPIAIGVFALFAVFRNKIAGLFGGGRNDDNDLSGV